ncbi:hypothetical protein WR25_00342 isoform A [Diploscapter pachys]|uniref:Acyl-CoA-binding domain-containing protein 6 n=1 Tax=Diploscapter pachys TaxID=2018661 RepID=A0A2A2L6M0_9BILA|nr:hypothetical protein WR25_00342 isoform A [Diploscapter pachys]
MVSIEDVRSRLEALSPEHLDVVDESDGCGAKFRIEIVSEQFKGQTTIKNHRLVQMFIVGLRRCWNNYRAKPSKEGTVPVQADEDIDPELMAQFDAAASFLPAIASKLSSTDLMSLYALYKQATCGPAIVSEKPSVFDVRARAKYDAWASLGNALSRENAMRNYTEKLTGFGWQPGEQPSHSKQGWGMRPSRMAMDEEEDESRNDSEESQWFDAARADDVEKMQTLLLKNPNLLEATDEYLGMTALHFAVDAGSEQVVEWLIDETNVDVNRQDPQGNTALHFAALCGRSNIAQLLISNGGDKNIDNDDGQLPWECTDEEPLIEILRP